MKICKNCGRQTDDEKVRCPYCGYLFEEDMDSVLRKMKENLNAYRDSVAAAPAQAPAAPRRRTPHRQLFRHNRTPHRQPPPRRRTQHLQLFRHNRTPHRRRPPRTEIANVLNCLRRSLN